MNELGLFAGIGGFSLGFEWAGLSKPVAFSEIEPYCQKVLAKHWPNAYQFGDIRNVTKESIEQSGVGPIDIVTGGFPCQPHSLAGKRLASRDERDLWGEYARVIGEIRPRWVVAENVRGLLSSENGRYFGKVLRDLAELGYDAEWHIIPAASIGAPHQRARLFLVAYPTCFGLESANNNRILCKQTNISGNNGFDSAEAWTNGDKSLGIDSKSAIESNFLRMVDGFSNSVDRLKALGNAIVPQVAQFVGECIKRAEAQTA